MMASLVRPMASMKPGVGGGTGTVAMPSTMCSSGKCSSCALCSATSRQRAAICTVPVPPPTPGFIEAMGRTNDAIIYAGRAQLFVEGDADAAKKLAEELPSANSKDYGKPFAELFAAVKGDFYAIDPMLFSPAKVTVTSLKTGESFQSGKIDDAVLQRSFA